MMILIYEKLRLVSSKRQLNFSQNEKTTPGGLSLKSVCGESRPIVMEAFVRVTLAQKTSISLFFFPSFSSELYLPSAILHSSGFFNPNVSDFLSLSRHLKPRSFTPTVFHLRIKNKSVKTYPKYFVAELSGLF